MGRTLGIDYGDRRIGVAVSDELGAMALPVITLEKERKLSDRVRRIIRLGKQYQVTAFVVGLPLLMSGEEGPQAQTTREFAERLKERSGLTVELVDERLSTQAAVRALDEMEVRGKRRKELVDQSAATIILQTWLDRTKSGTQR
jgi:putative Holliday junction resolvase